MNPATPFKRKSSADTPYLGIDGEIVSMALTKHCLHVKDADSAKTIHSVGIGEHSLAFTDTKTLLVIGEPDASYVVTDLRAAKLEAEEATIYDRPFDASNVAISDRTPENSPPEGDYPNVLRIINQVEQLDQWFEVAPESVRNIIQMAVKADAKRMMVGFSSDPDTNLVGFKFVAAPANPAPGHADAHRYQGCVIARPETEASTRGRGRPKKETQDDGQMALEIPDGEDEEPEFIPEIHGAINPGDDTEEPTVPYADGEGCLVQPVRVDDPVLEGAATTKPRGRRGKDQ